MAIGVEAGASVRACPSHNGGWRRKSRHLTLPVKQLVMFVRTIFTRMVCIGLASAYYDA